MEGNLLKSCIDFVVIRFAEDNCRHVEFLQLYNKGKLRIKRALNNLSYTNLHFQKWKDV